MRRFTPAGRRTLSIAGIGLAIVAFLALNTWGSLDLRAHRLDLTQNRQYTLSEGTKKLLGSMKEPVTVRLYVSEGLKQQNPFIGAYADRVRDMLRSYVDASGGKLDLQLIDPEPYSVAEDRAVGFGMRAIPLDNGGTAYLGVAGTNSTDDVDTLPMLSPEREPFLEYDLTRLIYNLANPEKPVVAMISGLPLNGDPAMQYQPWQVYRQLSQLFDIHLMGGDVASFDDKTRIVLVVQPENLSAKTLFAIDQFVLKGGKALVFVDPFSEAAAARQQQGRPGAATASDLPLLLKSWGLELVKGKVVGDPSAARQVQFPDAGGRPQVVNYLPWLSLPKDDLNGSEVMTAELKSLNVASAGYLQPVEGARTEFKALVSSSPEAEAIDVERVSAYPDPMGLLKDYKAGGQRLVMAARVTGSVKSAFPDGPPKGVEATGDVLKESKQPIEVVVFADTDLLDDRTYIANQNVFGQQVAIPVADNADFVANSLDFLAGSDALTGLRGRAVSLRPFTTVDDIRRNAEAQYQAKEQALVQQVQDLQQKIASMKVTEGDEGAILTPAQKKEIEGFQTQLLDSRRQLRDVQQALRSDIEGLRTNLRFLDIAAVPILVALFAIGLAIVRRIRFRRRFDATAA
jgi:ABC-type uncharacterized transport system involved in gliding motility auxiliary subunit